MQLMEMFEDIATGCHNEELLCLTFLNQVEEIMNPKIPSEVAGGHDAIFKLSSEIRKEIHEFGKRFRRMGR